MPLVDTLPPGFEGAPIVFLVELLRQEAKGEELPLVVRMPHIPIGVGMYACNVIWAAVTELNENMALDARDTDALV